MMSNIRWGAIQPLTGGMYIGAANAIGHDAEWIVSYPGLDEIKKDGDGKIVVAGNEANLFAWLDKHNRKVPYFKFDRTMFDKEWNDCNIELPKNEDGNVPNYDNIDLVVAVPVCSGLSKVTTASQKTKDERNCNMLFITNYTLNVVKPKMYVFENAPQLVTDRGESVRDQLEDIAMNAGYSVLYYKTDTQYHANPQKRPRTFVIFQKWIENGSQEPYKFGLEHIEASLKEYLKEIPEDATQQEPFKMTNFNKCLIEYAKNLYGDEWRSKSKRAMMENFTDADKWDEFKEFLHQHDIPQAELDKCDRFLDHARFKVSQGLNYYSMSAYLGSPDKIGSVQFKGMSSYLHPIEERHYSVREALHLMGLPHDFELLGDVEKNFPKIGQNVPVRTAYWIVRECVRILDEEWGKPRPAGNNKLFIYNK